MINKVGKIILLSGPSGVGKGSIAKELLSNKSLRLALSISMTTREIRHNEENNKNYFFVSKKEFKNNIKNHKLLEYAKFIGNYYGTPKKYCEEQIKKGRDILLEIELKGAMQVMENTSDYISFFILPPNLLELKKRLISRNTDSPNLIKKRIKKAKKEMKLKDKYDYIIVNNDIKKSAELITEILLEKR